jgi:uncharacterized protein YbjT (DUF2867 family)
MTKLTSKDTVTILGGNGFLGSYVVRELTQRTKAKIQVVSRSGEPKFPDFKTCGFPGQVVHTKLDLDNIRELENLIKSSTHVVNLIGILYEGGHQRFRRLHEELPRVLANMCNKFGVKRFVHVSALGVDKAKDSSYAYSKAEGDKRVHTEFRNATVVRPSVMVGPEDDFTNRFANMLKRTSIIPLLYFGKTRLQAVYVGDVAEFIVRCLGESNGKVGGKIFELAGPESYSMEKIVRMIAAAKNKKVFIPPLPVIFASFLAIISLFLSKPIITFDQITLLKHDNYAEYNDFDALDMEPRSIAPVIENYLKSSDNNS